MCSTNLTESICFINNGVWLVLQGFSKCTPMTWEAFILVFILPSYLHSQRFETTRRKPQWRTSVTTKADIRHWLILTRGNFFVYRTSFLIQQYNSLSISSSQILNQESSIEVEGLFYFCQDSNSRWVNKHLLRISEACSLGSGFGAACIWVWGFSVLASHVLEVLSEVLSLVRFGVARVCVCGAARALDLKSSRSHPEQWDLRSF